MAGRNHTPLKAACVPAPHPSLKKRSKVHPGRLKRCPLPHKKPGFPPPPVPPSRCQCFSAFLSSWLPPPPCRSRLHIRPVFGISRLLGRFPAGNLLNAFKRVLIRFKRGLVPIKNGTPPGVPGRTGFAIPTGLFPLGSVSLCPRASCTGTNQPSAFFAFPVCPILPLAAGCPAAPLSSHHR